MKYVILMTALVAACAVGENGSDTEVAVVNSWDDTETSDEIVEGEDTEPAVENPWDDTETSDVVIVDDTGAEEDTEPVVENPWDDTGEIVDSDRSDENTAGNDEDTDAIEYTSEETSPEDGMDTVDGGLDGGVSDEESYESNGEDYEEDTEGAGDVDAGVFEEDAEGDTEDAEDAVIDTDTDFESIADIFPPGTCYEGNIYVTSQSNMWKLDDVICINGDLTIAYSDDITEINLPVLSHVFGAVTITYNGALESIDIPNFSRADKPLLVTMNEFLPTCEGYELVVAARDRDGLGSGSLVSGNAMDGCMQPWECYQWGVEINDQEDMNKFHSVRCFKHTIYVESDTLENVAFPFLSRASQGIHIQNSPMITEISLPELKYGNGLYIENNASLSTCMAVEVAEGVVERAEEGYFTAIVIDGNFDDGCEW
jgi:hypothetical protein